jgi:hypothetical protein
VDEKYLLPFTNNLFTIYYVLLPTSPKGTSETNSNKKSLTAEMFFHEKSSAVRLSFSLITLYGRVDSGRIKDPFLCAP